MTKPKNDGRKSDGKFAPGNKLGGSKAGSRHRVTLAIEEMLSGEHEALTRAAIDRALNGDTVALRLCLDRIAPPRRDAPVTVALPPIQSASDTVAASTAILAAVSSGDITPDEAGRVMALLAAHRAIVETGELELRLAKLEERI